MKLKEFVPQRYLIFVVVFTLSFKVAAGYTCWMCSQMFETDDSVSGCEHETEETRDFFQKNTGARKSVHTDSELHKMNKIEFFNTLSQEQAFLGSDYSVISFDRTKMMEMLKPYEKRVQVTDTRVITYLHGGVATHMLKHQFTHNWSLTNEVYQYAQHFSAQLAGETGVQNVSQIPEITDILEGIGEGLERGKIVFLTDILHQYQDILDSKCKNQSVLVNFLDFKTSAAPAPIMLTVVRYNNKYAVCAPSGIITHSDKVFMTKAQVVQCVRWLHHYYSPHLKPSTAAGILAYRADVFTNHHAPAWANRSIPVRYVAAGAALAAGVGVAGWYFLKK